MSEIVDFFKEATKRNRNVLPTNVDELTIKDEEKVCVGEVLYEEDKAIVSVVQGKNLVSIDLVDLKTDTVYYKCLFDIYTLWLIADAVGKTFEHIEGITSEYS